MAHGFNCWHSKRTVVGHILKFAGKNWQILALSRQSWKEMGKAFVQQWTYDA